MLLKSAYSHIIFSLIGFFLAAASCTQVEKLPRYSLSLDDNWQFYFGDVENAFSQGHNTLNWENVNTPHDASVEAGYGAGNTPQNGYLPSGIGWYRRKIEIKKEWLGKQVLLHFDGIYMNSTVWLNGKKVGGRPYGFMSFYCDLSHAMHAGENLLEVKVDNTPPPTARFYHGTSIYGHVNLLVLPPLHINPLGGVYVQTEKVDNGRARVKIITELLDLSKKDEEVTVQERILDSKIHMAVHSSRKVKVIAGDTTTSDVVLIVKDPKLWSPETPYLYTVETTVRRKGKVIDKTETRFGIRTFRFDAQTGFWLNHKNLKLKGVCEHMEMMPVGFAVPDEMWRWRIETLKSMGTNAIRMAHNPFPPVFYDLCDRYGIMVIDEVFDGWHRKKANDYGGRFFKKWWRRDVEDWVRRDRNQAP